MSTYNTRIYDFLNTQYIIIDRFAVKGIYQHRWIQVSEYPDRNGINIYSNSPEAYELQLINKPWLFLCVTQINGTGLTTLSANHCMNLIDFHQLKEHDTTLSFAGIN